MSCTSHSIKNNWLGHYTYTNKPYHATIRTIPIWVDKNFGNLDQLSIDDAIHQWNYALNGYIKLIVVDTHFDMEINKIEERNRTNGWFFLKIDSKNTMIPSTEEGYKTIGFCDRIGGKFMYIVRDRLSNEEVFGVVLHEAGHLGGVDHVGEDLMYKHYSLAGYQCIDYETIKAVSLYQGLPVNELNYCVSQTK